MADDNAGPSLFTGQPLWLVIGAVALLVLALGGGGYWWLHHKHKTVAAVSHPHLIGALGDTVTELDNAAPDQDKLCQAGLKRAVDFGVLPPGSTLSSSDAKAGERDGHFTCEAQGADGKYTLSVDLSCPNSDAKTCFTLDSVRREDGSFAYQREM